MNANELADKLNSSNTNGNLCDEAATMLRQQQAEIEALKAEANPYKSITNTKIEPTVVSYTHPVKEELTDEEIMDYVEAFSIDMGNVYEFQPDNVLQMIRAILDKAQEK